VHMGLVRWLCLGSVPAAFAGVLVLKSMGEGQVLQDRVSIALGVALLVAAAAMVVKGMLQRGRGGEVHDIRLRPLPTVLIGVVGGLVVGMTSVGSGSLMIVLLLAVYPNLVTSQLVGTDLVQAVPLVLSAALGHALFGDLQLSLTTSLLLGSIPGVYVGARASSRAPDWVIRPVLVLVLVLSGLKLFDVSARWLAAVLAVGSVVLGVLAYRRIRATRREAGVPVRR
ncbi:MAG TPA: sulfite exporter TauE/SafE family protein, partial [Acidimicrobiales bacterium]|nr:sulfite exporter TauE/SafE family protein [Acidimicrobiales bacterium]